MAQSSRVLLLTREPTIQHLVEQICLIDGHRTVTAATVDEAHALIAQSSGDALTLAVIDTAALGASDQQQQRVARQLAILTGKISPRFTPQDQVPDYLGTADAKRTKRRG
jgi:hypothetical protein